MLGDEERGLGRVALDFPDAIDPGQLRIVRQRTRGQGTFSLTTHPGLVPGDGDLTDGLIPGAAQLHPAGGGDDLTDRHLVLG